MFCVKSCMFSRGKTKKRVNEENLFGLLKYWRQFFLLLSTLLARSSLRWWKSNLLCSDKEKSSGEVFSQRRECPSNRPEHLKQQNCKLAHNVPVCVFPATLMSQDHFRPNGSQVSRLQRGRKRVFGQKVGSTKIDLKNLFFFTIITFGFAVNHMCWGVPWARGL